MRADKIKVIDEVWNDARIDSFLDKQPLGDEPADFSKLLNAYRSMRVDDFSIFLARFEAKGGNRHATNNAGQTLSDIIKNHRQSGAFLTLLND
jgi:hypothetical protein